jgi:hypothetical protein
MLPPSRAPQSTDTLAEGIATVTIAEGISIIHRLAAGVVLMNLVPIRDLARLQVAAKAGDEQAIAAIRAIGHSIGNLIAGVAVGRPPPCFVCARPMMTYRDTAFCVIVPHAPGPAHTLTGVVCQDCTRLPDLKARAATAMRSIWPNARKIEIADAVGHA